MPTDRLRPDVSVVRRTNIFPNTRRNRHDDNNNNNAIFVCAVSFRPLRGSRPRGGRRVLLRRARRGRGSQDEKRREEKLPKNE